MTTQKIEILPSVASTDRPQSFAIHNDTPRPIDASAAYQDNQQDDLDDLMQSLSSADPSFGELLAQAGRDLAPLATTREGGVTITSLRMQAGLTQKQLAEKIGQKQPNISQFESGQRKDLNRATMRLLCAALSCDMNTLDEALENSSRAFEKHLDQQDTAITHVVEHKLEKAA